MEVSAIERGQLWRVNITIFTPSTRHHHDYFRIFSKGGSYPVLGREHVKTKRVS